MSEIKKILERLRTFTVPELCDGLPLYHVMDHEIKPRVGSTHIVGTAVTVDVPSGEGGIVADAILSLKPGDIICADRNGVLVMRPEEALEAMAKSLDKKQRQEATVREMIETGKVMTKIKKSV